MKWVCILLLLGNVVYLGWEIDRDDRLDRANVLSAIKVPTGTQRLLLLTELEKLPEIRSHIGYPARFNALAVASNEIAMQ